jgi:murein L,D-transpeptidase YcbB/YkuD
MQIALNMERWRWLPRKEPASRVEVNIAAAMLNAFVDDKSVLEMLAIAGKPMRDDMTPMLISKITSITFNPPWIVPKDIARRELFPKERHDHHYFAREGFRVRRGHLVQEPGPKNALGRIKFDSTMLSACICTIHQTKEPSFSSAAPSVTDAYVFNSPLSWRNCFLPAHRDGPLRKSIKPFPTPIP